MRVRRVRGPSVVMDLIILCVICLATASLAANEVVQTREIIELKSEENGTENTTKEGERDSRGLLKKLSFLAGLKAGGGLVSSSGTLAASNSLRIFGKVMNTALSVSYGHVDELDPLPDVQADQASGEKERAGLKQQGKLTAARKDFIKQHNAQVSRVNHKFLRSEPQPVLRLQPS